MDLVGDAIRSFRSGTPRSARAYLYGAWGLGWRSERGSAFNIHIVADGEGWLLPCDRDPIQLHTGDVVFVAGFLAHALANAPEAAITDVPDDRRQYWFRDRPEDAMPQASAVTVLIGGTYYFNRRWTHPLIEGLPALTVLAGAAATDDPLGQVVRLLGAEHDEDQPGSSAAIPALLDLLLTYVVRATLDAADRHVGWGAALRDRALSTALRNIHNRPEIGWTVDSLARASGVSRATLARRFSHTLGRSPMIYLTWWRMNLAQQLLAESDLSLPAIALRTSYNSEFAFSKAFKREVGQPPAAYRRASRDSRRTGLNF